MIGQSHVELADDLSIKARTCSLDKVLVDDLCEGYAVAGRSITGAVTFETRDVLNTLNGRASSAWAGTRSRACARWHGRAGRAACACLPR